MCEGGAINIKQSDGFKKQNKRQYNSKYAINRERHIRDDRKLQGFSWKKQRETQLYKRKNRNTRKDKRVQAIKEPKDCRNRTVMVDYPQKTV